MSRFTKEFDAAHEVSIDLSALLHAVSNADLDDHARRSAMACLLSGGRGWKQAAESLRGTFAEGLESESWLTVAKDR